MPHLSVPPILIYGLGQKERATKQKKEPSFVSKRIVSATHALKNLQTMNQEKDWFLDFAGASETPEIWEK
jgi:hypothetical protein